MNQTMKRYTFLYWSVAMSFIILILVLSIPTVNAKGNTDNDAEDESIIQHDMFEFEASIRHSDIIDGTAPFDSNDEAGNDSDPNNGIVRTWDTVTYPVKVTVNPKKADMLKNIKLRISGTLDNGIVDGDRVNAKFAVGGTEDIAKNEVSFVQEYTIERTGNSIMIPITVEVQGAKHGVKLRPDIKVEVVSVDGQAVRGAVSEFDRLPSATVSAKVNIKPIINSMLTGDGLPYLPYSKMYSGGSEYNGIQQFAISWSVDRLPNKSDLRGATMPDSLGSINYRIELHGDVYWDSKGSGKQGTEYFNFEGRDVPFKLFDHQPINTVRNKIGQKHTLSEGMAYTQPYPHYHVAARSKMPNYNESTIRINAYNTVWDSGEWSLSKPEITKNKVIYKGTNTDYVIGSTFPMRHAYVANLDMYRIYGLNDKVFATQSFQLNMQNEYRIGGKLNPENYSNNVYYRVNVILEDYVDKDGVITFNKTATISTVLRNATGNLAAYGTFQQYPSGYTSPKNPYNYSASVGDAHIIPGQDVNFTPRLNAQVNLYGGYTAAYRWNTDAFELTREYAVIAERNILARGYRNLTFDWVTNDKENQTVKYGVAKHTDNSFRAYTSRNIDDYTWYNTFDEAVRTGKPVGAMLSDVRAPVGGYKGAALNIPLRVKHENIGFGSVTKNGTPVIALINAHVFYDEKRETMVDVTKNRSYNNYSEWDDSGQLLKLQAPVGGGVNFETLAVIPAKTSTTIKSNKQTYYNSETVSWTADSSVVLPAHGVPDNVDAGITLTHKLPKGLDYKTGTGSVDGVATEPELKSNSDGTKELVWNLFISNVDRKIPKVTFDTTINPFALSSGVQSSLTVTGVIESALDGGPINARTGTQTITILKVGMVGIYESIDKTYGDKNSNFKLTLSPYTTIEDELDVSGITVIPLSNDMLGSLYNGDVQIKDIAVHADRKHNNEVELYLNNKPVYNDRPHKIDVTKDGWYKYTGEEDISEAVSLLFIVDGIMTNTDDIQIEIGIQTSDNEFNDRYLNETIINSATDYRLSPISNRVRYTIRADLELSLERFRIYTNKHDKGLPTSVRVHQTVLNQERVKDSPITLAIYDTSTGDKVAEKEYKQHELQAENNIEIPSRVLEKADVQNYEVRIEGYDTDFIWVKDGEDKIDTDGHTSIEKTLSNDDINENGDAVFKGVVMTERELGRDITEYYETIKINRIAEQNIKSGYGFNYNPKVDYTNELMTSVVSRVGINNQVNTTMIVDNELLDDTLEFYDADAGEATIPMNIRDTNIGVTSMNLTYELPKMYLEQDSGKMYTENQKSNGEIEGVAIDAGYMLYVPIWIDNLQDYNIGIKSLESLGSHHINFDLLSKINVYAYMFSHIDSETPEEDEMLLHSSPKNNSDE